MSESGWRGELPTLTSRAVTLREPSAADLGALVDVLSIADASRFGLEDVTVASVRELIERAQRDRAAGVALTYAIVSHAAGAIAGLIQVRQLDPGFEAAEWEATLVPSARGSGVFVEAARLVGSFVFASLG